MLPHKEIVLPEVDLSHDEGDPRWHEAGGHWSVPVGWDKGGNVSWWRMTGLAPGFWAGYWPLIADSWTDTVRAYEAHPDDAFLAWHYLNEHPAFWRFGREVREELPWNHLGRIQRDGAMVEGWPEITPHKVCPETGCIEDDESLNTRLEWWYEFGPWALEGHSVHDYELDGGAATYEEAVIEIAKKVWSEYGNDRRVVDSEEWRKGGGDGQIVE